MRDQAMDATRSVSHFGIIAANMPFFAIPGGYGLSWWLQGSVFADIAAVVFIRALCEGPFIGLFTLLFGFGIAQQLDRYGRVFVFKRAALLGVLGLFHGLLLFAGDILLGYALCAAVYVLLRPRIRNMPAAIVAGISLSVLGLFAISALQFLIELPRPMGDSLLAVMQSGDALAVLMLNVQGWIGFYIAMPLHLFFFIFGSFVVGAWIYERWGNLLDAVKVLGPWQGVLWSVGLFGSGIYSLLMFLGQIQQIPALEFLASPLRPLFGFVLMLPLLRTIYLVMNGNLENPIVRVFIRTGRASLSLYVAQSLIGVAVFHGLGLFAAFSMWQVLALSFVTLVILQLAMALWLMTFSDGPLEMVMKLRPTRKSTPSKA